jgi:hypothetical protein
MDISPVDLPLQKQILPEILGHSAHLLKSKKQKLDIVRRPPSEKDSRKR